MGAVFFHGHLLFAHLACPWIGYYSVVMIRRPDHPDRKFPWRSLGTIFLLLGLAVLSACQSTDTLSSAKITDGRDLLTGPLGPQKDKLFAYRPALEQRDNGDYLLVPYDEQRDINKRDEMPVRKVRSIYTEKIPPAKIHDLTYVSEGRTLNMHAAGRVEGGARFSVVYIHGKGGNRDWGFDDERFGGNFNRLKNLMVKNGGAYYSPDFTNFDDEGKADIAALVTELFNKNSGKIVIACGSLGNKICWSLANNAVTLNMISGFVILSGFPDADFLRVAYSGAFAPVPVYIAHGSRDKVYDKAAMDDFYNALQAKDYPARMSVFDGGNHGTPIRMIDWRHALNWIFSQS